MKKYQIEPKLHPFKVGKTVKKVVFTAFVCCFELPTPYEKLLGTCGKIHFGTKMCDGPDVAFSYT